jgi:hypothetical protein
LAVSGVIPNIISDFLMFTAAFFFAVELALIEYFMNTLLLVLKIWDEPFNLKYTKNIVLLYS